MSVAHHLSRIEHGVQTRHRLLDVAESLFAEHGFAATSVRDITAAAECNLAAVNYHFGGKANLYREAFLRGLRVQREHRLDALRKATARRPAPDVEEVLHAFARAFVAPLDHTHGPFIFQLWMRELLDPQLPAGTFADEMILPMRRALVAALRSLEPTLAERDAVLCIQSFVAQLFNVFHLQRFKGPGAPGTIPATPAEHVRHIAAFTAAGIRAAATRGLQAAQQKEE